MRASQLAIAMLCAFLGMLLCGCAKSPKADDLLVPKEELAQRRADKAKGGQAVAKAPPEAAAKGGEPAPAPAQVEEKVEPAEAAPTTASAAEGEEGTSAERFVQAWGHRGKDRYSQATAGQKREQDELAIASGPDYSRKSDSEIDELRAEEQRGPLPRADLFRVLGYIRTPFRMIGKAPVITAEAPGAEAAAPGGTPAPPGAEQPTRVAEANPPVGPAGPITVPPVGAEVPGAAQPGQVQGPVIIPERVPTARRLSPEQRRELEAKQFLSERFGVPQSGATRPAPEPAMNLSVAGTVVGNDGRATAILSDGTSSVWVKEGDRFTFNGRSFRVVRVARGRVDISDGKQEVALGVGGSSP